MQINRLTGTQVGGPWREGEDAKVPRRVWLSVGFGTFLRKAKAGLVRQWSRPWLLPRGGTQGEVNRRALRSSEDQAAHVR